jgi:hypothetical protein
MDDLVKEIRCDIAKRLGVDDKELDRILHYVNRGNLWLGFNYCDDCIERYSKKI